jgi:hypothetical protein
LKAGLIRFPETRPEFKLRRHSPSRLKTTQKVIFSPMQEDFSYETGVLTPGGLWLGENESALLLKGGWGDLTDARYFTLTSYSLLSSRLQTYF